MKTLFLEGGFPMWFILALGLVSIGSAGAFAARPSKARERFVEEMARATFWATLVGLTLALGTVFHYVAGHEMAHEKRIQIMLMGFGESMAPTIIGFAFLSIVSLLLGVGKGRLDSRENA